MIKQSFMVGPFEVRPKFGERVDIVYGDSTIAHNIDVTGTTRNEIAESLSDCFLRIRGELRERTPLYTINLVRDGERVASFLSEDHIIPGMTPGLCDDRAEFWLQSADRRHSMPVGIDEYATIRAGNAAIALGWVANLLPDDVMTNDPEQWRAPTRWEIRHVVGEGSFSGTSGAKAASLIGMTAQNFRKYTAADGASTRQSISYAAWHLLLRKMGVKRY